MPRKDASRPQVDIIMPRVPMGDWPLRGACNDYDPELWDPVNTRSADARFAKRICQGCDVREECLDYALKNGEDSLIWGGYDERERRKIRRKRLQEIPRDSTDVALSSGAGTWSYEALARLRELLTVKRLPINDVAVELGESVGAIRAACVEHNISLSTVSTSGLVSAADEL